MEKKIVTLIEKRTKKQGYNFKSDNSNVVSFYQNTTTTTKYQRYGIHASFI